MGFFFLSIYFYLESALKITVGQKSYFFRERRTESVSGISGVTSKSKIAHKALDIQPQPKQSEVINYKLQPGTRQARSADGDPTCPYFP